MPRRCFVLLITLIAGAGYPLQALAGDTDTPDRGFDLRLALDEALVSELARARWDQTDELVTRHQRASLLMTPAWASDAGGGGSTGAERRPGDWLVGGFDETSRWATLGTFVVLGGYFALADLDDVRELGDITQLIPAATGLGLTVGTGDWQGLKELALAGGTSMVLTHGIKEVVDKTRPDTSANNSFPSGHTSASVTGAAFIWRRYGPKWGAPASLFATYTGLSRVLGEKHFMDDVLSGAAIGLISNWLWTDPIDERVQMALFPTAGGVGVNMTIDPSAPASETATDEQFGVVPTRYFMWEIGGSEVTRNRVIAPNPGGTPIDFQFNEENDPTTTAFILVNWSNEKGQYDAYGAFAPFEIREVVELERDLVFGGVTVPAGTVVQTRYLSYDYRAGFEWAVVNRPKYRFTAGGAAALFFTEVGMVEEDGVDLSTSTTVVRPVARVGFDASLGRRLLVFSGMSWWADSNVTICDGTAQIGVRLHPKWTMSLGYRRVERSVKERKLYTNVHRNQIALGVFYGW